MSLFKYGFSSSSQGDEDKKKEKAERKLNKNMRKKCDHDRLLPNGLRNFHGLNMMKAKRNDLHGVQKIKYEKEGRFVEGTSNFRIDSLKQHDSSSSHTGA